VLLSLGRLRTNETGQDELLDLAIDELATGLQELRELAQGLHPSVLSERGLSAALGALALRAPVPVDLVETPEDRLPEPVEVAAYYVVSEALANVQKHAGARSVNVKATARGHELLVEVTDDGTGGADESGLGLRGLADRVEALGGSLELTSPAGGGTSIRATIPLADNPQEAGG